MTHFWTLHQTASKIMDAFWKKPDCPHKSLLGEAIKPDRILALSIFKAYSCFHSLQKIELLSSSNRMLCVIEGFLKKQFRSNYIWSALLLCINPVKNLNNQMKRAFMWENSNGSCLHFSPVKCMLVTYILKVTCYSITFAKRLIWSSETVLLVLPGVLVGSEPSASTLGQTFKSCIPCRNILHGKMQNHFSKFKIIQLSGIKVEQQLQENEVASFAKATKLHNWTLLCKRLAPCVLYNLYFNGTWCLEENCEVRGNLSGKRKKKGKSQSQWGGTNTNWGESSTFIVSLFVMKQKVFLLTCKL